MLAPASREHRVGNNWMSRSFHAEVLLGLDLDLDIPMKKTQMSAIFRAISSVAHLERGEELTAPPWPASASGPLLYGFPPYCEY